MKSSKHSTKRRRTVAASAKVSILDHRAILARRLDLIAGIELQHGHHRQAEFLAHEAARLRASA